MRIKVQTQNDKRLPDIHAMLRQIEDRAAGRQSAGQLADALRQVSAHFGLPLRIRKRAS